MATNAWVDRFCPTNIVPETDAGEGTPVTISPDTGLTLRVVYTG